MDLFNDLFNADDVNTLFGTDEKKGGDLFGSPESNKEEAAPKKDEAAPKKEEAAPKKEEAAPKKEEAAPKKEEAAPKKEEAAKKETPKKEESSKASAPKETKSKTKKTDQDKLLVNPTWTIAYAAQIYTPPEVDMTLEDVRKFMEQDYPEFSNSRTKWDVDEEKMLLVPIIHGGKMG